VALTCKLEQFDDLAMKCGYCANILTFADGTTTYIFNFELDTFPNIDYAKITAEFDKFNNLVSLSNKIIEIDKSKIKLHLLTGFIESLNKDQSDNVIFKYDVSGSSVAVYVSYDINAVSHEYLGVNRSFDPNSLMKCFTMLIYEADSMYPEFDKIQYY